MKLDVRLKEVMRGGNLTVADLARWFERPHPTVRGWVHGTGLGGPHGDKQLILTELARIETMIKQKKALPVPRLSPAKRVTYIDALALRERRH